MEKWSRAFSRDSPDGILTLYAEDAFLWGTLSSIHRTDSDLIRDYFEQSFIFTDRKVTFNDSVIRCFGDLAISSGSYTFSLTKNGEKSLIPSRYSFTYINRENHWLIVEHHSSAMPEK